jgi:hypothetical protein
VAYNKSVNSVQQMMSTLQFAGEQSVQNQLSAAAQTTGQRDNHVEMSSQVHETILANGEEMV